MQRPVSKDATRSTRPVWICGISAILAILVLGGLALRALPLSAEEFGTSELRHWTTRSGVRSSVKLRVTKLDGAAVHLQREDGKSVVLQTSQLSAADLVYLRDLKANAASTLATASSNDSTDAATTDWVRWRGPNNDGVSQETGLLDSWPEGGPELAWTSSADLGHAYSSLAIWNDKIYTLGKKERTTLLCLSTDGGKLLWETPFAGGDKPNATPTVDPDAKLVFGLGREGDLICADAETGNEKWKVSFKDDFGGSMMSDWGYSESPLIDGNRVICTPGSDQAVMAALDKATGRVLWRTKMPAGRAGYASPVISHAGGVKQYVTLVGAGLIGVAADDGRLLWRYERIANGTANVPTPIVHGDLVFGSSGYGDGGSALIRLVRRGNMFQVQEMYYLKNNQLQNHHGGMVRIGDLIYMGHGHNNGLPVCFDLKKGQPLWGPVRGAGSGSAAITAADGKLYFRYQDGTVALIDATPKGYSLLGEFRAKTRHAEAWAHPVVAGKKLYLRDMHELHCYDIAK